MTASPPGLPDRPEQAPRRGRGGGAAGAGCRPRVPPVPTTPPGAVTPSAQATSDNSFHEFGPREDDPAHLAGSLCTQSWTVTIDGEVRKPVQLDLDPLRGWFPPQERV